jgi:hypothetical protein
MPVRSGVFGHAHVVAFQSWMLSVRTRTSNLGHLMNFASVFGSSRLHSEEAVELLCHHHYRDGVRSRGGGSHTCAPHLGVRTARSEWQCGKRGVGDEQVASLLVLQDSEGHEWLASNKATHK